MTNDLVPNIALWRNPRNLSGVDLVACSDSCSAAQAVAGPYAVEHAPLLPLIDCDRAGQCECGFRTYVKTIEETIAEFPPLPADVDYADDQGTGGLFREIERARRKQTG